MPKIITVGHLTTTSIEARNTLIESFEKIAEYSKQSEPGVSVYAITVPRDPSDDTTIYMIEEFVIVTNIHKICTLMNPLRYSDQATSDAHLASKPVQDLIALFGSKPVLAGAPLVYQLEPIYSFSKAHVSQVTDPHIVFANLEYRAGTADQSLQYWKNVVSSSEAEDGTLLYALAKEPANLDRLHTVEVYQSENYLWDVHAKSKAVTESVATTKDIRTGLVLSHLKQVGGFFCRS